MRSRLLPFGLLLLWSFSLEAQTNKLPEFGKIEKADLEMKDCDFDPGAEAVKLIDYGSIHYDRGVDMLKLVTERRIRIKILKDKGTSYANVTIPYYSYNNDQRISKIDAATYNLDAAGNMITTDVDKKSIYSHNITKRFAEWIIAFPAVKAGSIIEYRYRIESEYYWMLDDWYFQDEIPTRLSRLDIKSPKLFVFSDDPFIYMDHEDKKEEKDEFITVGNGDLARFTMNNRSITLRNVPGIHDEPFQPTKKDYMQRISFQLSKIDNGGGAVKEFRTNWQDIQKRLEEDDDFGKELNRSLPPLDGLQAEVDKCSDQHCKMLAVFYYVRSHMSFNGDDDKYSMQGSKAAWEKKSGSSGDINFLLIKALRQAGVQAKPILFSTKDNGLVNMFYPTEKQFNTVMAYVEEGNKYFLLNAADKYSAYNIIPYDAANSNGFLVDGEEGRWIMISKPEHKFRQMAAVQAEIDASGQMKGTATINSMGYARNEKTRLWMQDKADFKQRYFIKPYSNMNIDEVEVNNASDDTLALEQKLKFHTNLNSSGDYRYFNLNLFSGLEANPFVEDERQTDIDYGYLQEYMIYGNYNIPEGYVFDELPKSTTMIMPDTSIQFTRFVNAENNSLNIRISVEFKRSFYSPRSYDYFKEFYKQLFDKLNEQIVIKKK